MNWYTGLRQWMFPRQFRILAPAWPPDLRAALAELVETLGQIGQGEPLPATVAVENEISPRLLADVSTGLWRLQQKLATAGGDAARDGRRALRHLEAVQDALTQAGVEIVDHTHEPYAAGLALKVIAFQPMDGLQREQVLETIKPTVYLKGRAIQVGEVIVATPTTNQGDKKHETRHD